jgi:hypothetical protein
MSTRTDIHAPSAFAFDPEAYTLRGCFDMAPDFPAPEMVKHRLAVIAELIENGYKFGAGSSRNCGHCGAHIRYAALMVREDVKEFIYVGETCLDNRFSVSKAEFDQMRKASAALRAAYKGTTKFIAFCDANQNVAYASYVDNFSDEDVRAMGIGWECGVLSDMAWKAHKYGDLSVKQLAFMSSLFDKISLKAEKLVEREAVKATLPPVVEGRYIIEGEVVSLKTESGYTWNSPDVTKVLVKLADGTKVYGTLPAAIDDAEKGDIVSFTATVTRSTKDHTFGIFKRPMQAHMMKAA